MTRRTTPGEIPAKLIEILVALHERAHGNGETERESAQRTADGFGDDAREGARRWRAWCEAWRGGDVLAPSAEASAAAARWCAHDGAGDEGLLAEWVRVQPETVGMLATAIARALGPKPDTAGAAVRTACAEALGVRLGALGATRPGLVEPTGARLVGECEAQGRRGAAALGEAMRRTIAQIRALGASPKLEFICAVNEVALLEGQRRWDEVREARVRAVEPASAAAPEIKHWAKLTTVGEERWLDSWAKIGALRNAREPERGENESAEQAYERYGAVRAARGSEGALEAIEKEIAAHGPSGAALAEQGLLLAGLGLEIAAADALEAMGRSTAVHPAQRAETALMLAQSERRRTRAMARKKMLQGEVPDATGRAEGARESLEVTLAGLAAHGVATPRAGRTARLIDETMQALRHATPESAPLGRWLALLGKNDWDGDERSKRACRAKVVFHPEMSPDKMALIGFDELMVGKTERALKSLEYATTLALARQGTARAIAGVRCGGLAELLEDGAEPGGWLARETCEERIARAGFDGPGGASAALRAWKQGQAHAGEPAYEAMAEMLGGTMQREAEPGANMRAELGEAMVHEVLATLRINTLFGRMLDEDGDESDAGELASALQYHHEYAAWRAWLGPARPGDDRALLAIIEHADLMAFAEAMGEHEGDGR